MVEPPAKVLVTGANGFLAQHVVKQLLDAGYSVKGTVRGLADRSKYAFLWEVSTGADEASGRLEFVELDLTKSEGWTEAVSGCAAVCAVAMNVIHPSKRHGDGNPRKAFLEPALRGMENVLTASVASGTVKRIVFTSSVTALSETFRGWRRKVFGPDDWNTTSSLRRNPYAFAKVSAERALISWCADKSKNTTGIEWVSIVPDSLLGPPLGPKPSEPDVESLLRPMQGAIPFIPPICLGFSDVRDVASAHVAAVRLAGAAGRRFIAIGEVVDAATYFGYLGQRYPEIQSRLPRHGVSRRVVMAYARACLNPNVAGYLAANTGIRPRFDTSALASLGVSIRPAKATVEDSAAWYVAHGMVSLKSSDEPHEVVAAVPKA